MGGGSRLSQEKKPPKNYEDKIISFSCFCGSGMTLPMVGRPCLILQNMSIIILFLNNFSTIIFLFTVYNFIKIRVYCSTIVNYPITWGEGSTSYYWHSVQLITTMPKKELKVLTSKTVHTLKVHLMMQLLLHKIPKQALKPLRGSQNNIFQESCTTHHSNSCQTFKVAHLSSKRTTSTVLQHYWRASPNKQFMCGKNMPKTDKESAHKAQRFRHLNIAFIPFSKHGIVKVNLLQCILIILKIYCACIVA